MSCYVHPLVPLCTHASAGRAGQRVEGAPDAGRGAVPPGPHATPPHRVRHAASALHAGGWVFLLIVFGTLLVRFMQVGWVGVGTPVGQASRLCALGCGCGWGGHLFPAHGELGSRWGVLCFLGALCRLTAQWLLLVVHHPATTTLPARVPIQRRLPSPPPLCVHLPGQVLIGASNVWTGAFNTVRTSLKEGVLLCEAWTNATQRLCTQAWASSEDTHR
jgi:hypothetical protein